MTDREKLVDLLWQCVDLDTPFGEVADYLLANGVRLEPEQATSDENKRWIPVSERLPEPETDVLTFCCGNIDILTYRYDRWGKVCFMYRDDSGYWKETFGKVTHWMPLPEPPTRENT